MVPIAFSSAVLQQQHRMRVAPWPKVSVALLVQNAISRTADFVYECQKELQTRMYSTVFTKYLSKPLGSKLHMIDYARRLSNSFAVVQNS